MGLAAVAEQQGNGARHRRFGVYKVDVELFAQNFELGRVLRQLIKFGLLLPPVVPVLPVFCKSFDVLERCSKVPLRSVQLIRPGRPGKLLLEFRNLLFGYRNGIGEWSNHADGWHCGMA